MENPNSSKEFRHRLIQEEFRQILKGERYKIPVDTEAVVILSGPKAEVDGVLTDKSPENVARVETGIEVIKHIVAKKVGISWEEVTNENISSFAPILVLNGESQQLPPMAEIASDNDFPKDKIAIIDSGPPGISNTRTQFEVLNNDPRFKDAKHLTFITSGWHASRVIRTADKNLNPDIHFDVIPSGMDKSPYNVFRVIRGEVRRIESYSAKGDISKEAVLR